MKHQSLVTLVLLVIFGSPAVAQDRPIELGIDAGASLRLEQPRLTSISVPAQRLRVGFFVSDAVSVEPSVFLSHVRVAGESFSFYMADIGLLLHLTAAPATPTWYLRPFAGIVGVGGSDRTGNTDWTAGIGGGLKGPLAERLLWRAEANFRRHFAPGELDDAGVVGLALGVSFLTR
jgi:hypothetical protein